MAEAEHVIWEKIRWEDGQEGRVPYEEPWVSSNCQVYFSSFREMVKNFNPKVDYADLHFNEITSTPLQGKD